MKKAILVIVTGVLFGCGGGGGDGTSGQTSAAPPTVNVTGTWRGSVTSSLTGTSTVTYDLFQNGANVTGNYSTTAGALGSVTGTISGNTGTFTVTPSQAGCTGSISVTGNVTVPVGGGQPTMSFSYNGSTSCGGTENGTGNVTKQ